MIDLIKNISPTEILIIVVILVVLFGAKAMSKVGKSAGETVREVKKVKKEFMSAMDDDDSSSKK